MKEIGFWDYTAPGGGGGLERYSREDWDRLLDDMASGGFNSLALGIKWLTTGYRSRFDWLDQDPTCTAIASDNALLHYALHGARRRGIRTWLLVVASIYQAKQFKLHPPTGTWAGEIAVIDLDFPGLPERIELLFDEVAELFGQETDGIVVELEFCDGEAPHRIPIYNEWACRNNRPDFDTIKNIRLEPRAYPYSHWRDFTTSRRIEMLKRVERTVRARGFAGTLTSIIELDNAPAAVLGNVNMVMLREALPHWPVVTYDSIYDRRRNRLATMDFCIEQPRSLGFEVFYLSRGVMTFPLQAEMPPTTLEEQWRMTLDDAARFKPDILWFMSADARVDGPVASNVQLPAWGQPDGRTARLKLMQMAADMKQMMNDE